MVIRRLLPVSVLAVAMLVLVTNAFAASYSYAGEILTEDQYDLYTVDLVAGEGVTATIHCAPAPDNTLDSILAVFFPGTDTSDTVFAEVYNDDGGDESCGGYYNSSASFGAPVTGTYTFRVDGFGPTIGAYTLDIVTGGGNPMAADGRLNPQQDAPIILYCDGTSVNAYSVTGNFQGSVADDGTATFGAATISPTADGRMEVSAGLPDGKTYLFIWDGCGVKGHYEAYSVYNGVPSLYDSGSY